MVTTREIAEAVAKELFTNGSGQTARQLRLMIYDKHRPSILRDGGGWAFKPCVDQIEKIITPMLRDGIGWKDD